VRRKPPKGCENLRVERSEGLGILTNSGRTSVKSRRGPKPWAGGLTSKDEGSQPSDGTLKKSGTRTDEPDLKVRGRFAKKDPDELGNRFGPESQHGEPKEPCHRKQITRTHSRTSREAHHDFGDEDVEPLGR